MSRDILFDITIGRLYLYPLSDDDVIFILNIFRDNPYLPPPIFKEILFDENPELYNKLLKFNLID